MKLDKPTNVNGPARIVVRHEDESSLVRIEVYFAGYYDAVLFAERMQQELEGGKFILAFVEQPP